MIDFSTIEAELKTALLPIEKFKTIEIGRIRETVATAQMPALDISCFGHTYNFHDVEAQYKIPCAIIIRRVGFDRTDNANEFKVLFERACTILETLRGTAFNVVRGIDAQLQESDSGNGSIVRAGVIQITLWA
jgi:hypothetical protein